MWWKAGIANNFILLERAGELASNLDLSTRLSIVKAMAA